MSTETRNAVLEEAALVADSFAIEDIEELAKLREWPGGGGVPESVSAPLQAAATEAMAIAATIRAMKKGNQ